MAAEIAIAGLSATLPTGVLPQLDECFVSFGAVSDIGMVAPVGGSNAANGMRLTVLVFNPIEKHLRVAHAGAPVENIAFGPCSRPCWRPLSPRALCPVFVRSFLSPRLSPPQTRSQA